MITAPTGGITNVTTATTVPSLAGVHPGGTFTELLQSEVGGVDPILSQNTGNFDGPSSAVVFDMLVYSDHGTVTGQTAESLTSTDALTWTLKLRPNIRFTDGTPYDAAAVKFNIARLQDPANHAVRAPFANTIASMTVVDPLTLKMTLTGKNAVFPQLLVLMPFVGSPKAIQQEGDQFRNNPVGAGPFILKTWVRDSQMVMVRNPNYWNAPLPYLDQIIFRPVTSDDQRRNSRCVGDATLSMTASVDSYNQYVQGNCGVKTAVVLNGGTMVLMNVKKAPFTDQRVRQAVAMAIDSEDYSKVVNQGVIPPTRSAFNPSSRFYDSNILQPAYDPVKAQQLFDAAAADNGGPISFSVLLPNVLPWTTDGQYLQSALNKFRNVKVDLTYVSASVLVSTVPSNGNYQMAFYGFVWDDPEPLFTGTFSCTNPSTWTGFCDPAFDSAVANSRQTLDVNQRIQAIKDAEKVLYSGLPVLFLETRYSWYFMSEAVQNFQIVNDTLPLFDRVWLKG